LKKFVEGAYGVWNLWLPMVQISLNEVIGTRTKSAPFSLMHGRRFNQFMDFSETKTISDIKEAMKKRSGRWNEIRQAILPGIND
jgi:hypothetical protein